MTDMHRGKRVLLSLPKAPVSAPGSRLPDSKSRKVADLFRRIWRSDGGLQFALFIFMFFWYGALLRLAWRPSSRPPLDLTFNSMLSHLLRGQFDVDPLIVGVEGFLHDGRTYAYWGIWCALLRLPLWVINRMDTDMTFWSCLAAVCLAGLAKVRTLLLLRRHSLQNPIAGWLLGLTMIYILLGGSEVGFLKASIYQEVVSWAAAFGSFFVYFSIKGLVSRWFDLSTLCAMASCAGLALLTRASTGIGLVLAIVLLLGVLSLEAGEMPAERREPPFQRWGRTLIQRRILVSLSIIAGFIAVTGAVNYFRWGSPTTFSDNNHYIMNSVHPDRMLGMKTNGMFNASRIPFGLIYYFLPVWVFHDSGGQLFWERTQVHLVDTVELPPSSFLLTDLLSINLIVLLALALSKRGFGYLPRPRQWMAVATGLLVPCILMLMCIWMNYRYRMEFYPEIDFLAFTGLYITVSNEEMLAKVARARIGFVAALAVSAASSFVVSILYDLSDFAWAPSQWFLREGIGHYYYQRAIKHLYEVVPLFHSLRRPRG